MSTKRQIDPVTLATVAAVAGIVGGCASAVDFVQRHLPLSPTKAFRKLTKSLTLLSDDLGYLRKDIEILEQIFAGAGYENNDRTVRMDNGAFLTVAEYMRFERVSDATLGRLRRISKTSLKIERVATLLTPQGVRVPAAHMSPAMEKVEALLRSKDLTIDEAWGNARSAVDDLVKAVTKLREQISQH